MLGKTHALVGIAAAYTALLPTNNINLILCGTTVSALGAILPDIDVEGTDTVAKKQLKGGALLVAAYSLLTPVYAKLTNTAITLPLITSSTGMMGGLLLLTVYSVIGLRSKHRGFTHSLEGITLATAGVAMLVPVLAKWFALGYATHIALDLLNKRPVQLLTFFKKKTCLYLCTASGATDTVIRWGCKAYLAVITYLWLLGLAL